MSQNYYAGSQGTGGGFMVSGSSPFSGMDSPSGRNSRSDASQSTRPLTIAQLLKATQAHTDAAWKVDEMEIGHVTVVAQVLSASNHTTNRVYGLEDGTGKMEARRWVDATAAQQDDSIEENKFVRVVGTLKTFNSKRYINTVSIRPVTDPHEVYFHFLDCVAVSQILEKGLTIGGQQNGHAVNGVNGAGTSASAYTAQPSVVDDRFASMKPLQRAIMTFMSQNMSDDSGIPVGIIAKNLGGGYSAKQISEALDSLMNDGHVYTTIDDSHFGIAT